RPRAARARSRRARRSRAPSREPARYRDSGGTTATAPMRRLRCLPSEQPALELVERHVGLTGAHPARDAAAGAGPAVGQLVDAALVRRPELRAHAHPDPELGDRDVADVLLAEWRVGAVEQHRRADV